MSPRLTICIALKHAASAPAADFHGDSFGNSSAAGCRALLRAKGIRVRLGGAGGMDEPCPRKPKGMHWKTYCALARKEAYQSDASEFLMTRWLTNSLGLLGQEFRTNLSVKGDHMPIGLKPQFDGHWHPYRPVCAPATLKPRPREIDHHPAHVFMGLGPSQPARIVGYHSP